jgi:hypothetical protein
VVVRCERTTGEHRQIGWRMALYLKAFRARKDVSNSNDRASLSCFIFGVDPDFETTS